MRRALPALGLFLLAPLVAEFLIGDVPIDMPEALLTLAPMYGGGALLVRETARRTRRAWASLFALSLAYGVLEEAFMTQSLFNPDYLGLNLRLLEPAYVPALGIGAWWTVFVLTLHTVWSIPVSIALVEALVPSRAAEPWLGRPGLAATALLFSLVSVASGFDTVRSDKHHFVATIPQFAGSAILCGAVVAVALLLPRPSGGRDSGWVPSPWLVGLGALAMGSLFLLVPSGWARRAVAAYLALDLVAIVAIGLWSRRKGWDARHRLALAGGAALAYAWFAFTQRPVVGHGGPIVRVGNGVFAAGLVLLLLTAGRRTAAAVHDASGARSLSA